MNGESRLAGKVALVTGSTRGIGEAIARRFAAEGASVVVTGRSERRGERIARTIRSEGRDAVFVRADVSDESQVHHAVERAVEQYGRLTTLVNNAAPTDLVMPGGVDAAATTLNADDFDRILTIGVSSMFYFCKHAVPAMAEAGGGAIVNVSSTVSLLGAPGMTAYTAAKGAMNAMTKQMAVDFAPLSVRSNAIVVGLIVAPGDDLDVRLRADPAMAPALRSAQLTRFGTPEDIAAAALFLASDESEYLTGVLLPADGGMSSKMPTLPHFRGGAES